MTKLGSNIPSIMAQRRLSEASSSYSRTLERLSSGMRINRASDDAAGLAIADSLRAESRVLSVASRNIDNAVSLLTIADSVLESQSQIVIRLKELAEQAANGTYSQTQRKALESEYRALVSEFDRVGRTAEFNGISLLTSAGNLAFQVGTDSSGQSSISTALEQSTTGIGVVGAEGNYDSTPGVDAGDFTALLVFAATPRTLDELYNFYGTNALKFAVKDSAGNQRNVIAFMTLSGFGAGANFLLYHFERSDGLYGVDSALDSIPTSGDKTVAETIQFSDTGTTADLTIDFNNYSIISVDVDGFAQTTALEFTGADTQSRGRDALAVLTSRHEQILSNRAGIGASLSRLSAAAAIAASRRENVLAAESRIRDADIAEEAARLVSQQILQQAATAVLAQANQSPALVLKLIT